MTRIDLHAHTDHSDGTLPPAALGRLARDAGLAMLAVTDHDTTSAVSEVRSTAAPLGVEVLDGCEISTQIGGNTVHVLAYAFAPDDAGFRAFLAGVRERRTERNERLYARLAELGVPVTPDDVNAFVRGRIVGRPHFARAMVARGYAPDVRTAFHRWLHDRGPAYVEPDTPAPEAAIAAVRAAGGVAVLAHPKQIRLDGPEAYAVLFRRLAAAGLAGIEVDHPSHGAEDRATFRRLASEIGLVASGGSDFHGENKPHIALGDGDGTIAMTSETWDRLLERRP